MIVQLSPLLISATGRLGSSITHVDTTARHSAPAHPCQICVGLPRRKRKRKPPALGVNDVRRNFAKASYIWSSFTPEEKMVWRRAIKVPGISAYDVWMADTLHNFRRDRYAPANPTPSSGCRRRCKSPHPLPPITPPDEGDKWQPPFPDPGYWDAANDCNFGNPERKAPPYWEAYVLPDLDTCIHKIGEWMAEDPEFAWEMAYDEYWWDSWTGVPYQQFGDVHSNYQYQPFDDYVSCRTYQQLGIKFDLSPENLGVEFGDIEAIEWDVQVSAAPDVHWASIVSEQLLITPPYVIGHYRMGNLKNHYGELWGAVIEDPDYLAMFPYQAGTRISVGTPTIPFNHFRLHLWGYL